MLTMEVFDIIYLFTFSPSDVPISRDEDDRVPSIAKLELRLISSRRI